MIVTEKTTRGATKNTLIWISYLLTVTYANNRMEADHGQLKRRLRPMRGLKSDHQARIVIAGHAFIQNIRRGHYELGVEEAATLRVAAAFDELALAI